ncbi:unnamed protein product [Dicrocoelium dendriticum]|nr:unnamed protein product [Dicrocoelium dendriticum]
MSASSVDFDSLLLTKLLDTFSDRIHTKTFANLQRQTDGDVEQINQAVERFLAEGNELQHWASSILQASTTAHQLKRMVLNRNWNREFYEPNTARIHKCVEESFRERHKKLEQLFADYLTHRDTKCYQDVTTAVANKDKEGKRMTTKFEDTYGNAYRGSTKPSTTGYLKHQSSTSCPFDRQWRPSPGPASWNRVPLTNIESEVRTKSRYRLSGAFNASEITTRMAKGWC